MTPTPSTWFASPAPPRGLPLVGGPERSLYLQPCGLVSGPAATAAAAAGSGRPLAGSAQMFTALTLLWRDGTTVGEAVLPCLQLLDWAEAEGEAVAAHVARLMSRISAARAPFAGLPADRPLVMGVVNPTPDSFSDGGDYADTDRAIARGLAMAAAGADIVDVGGESTRPGAAPVSLAEELARVVPVVRALAAAGVTVSVDTRHAAVMAAALAAGGRILNDVTGLADRDALALAAEAAVPVILMHMQGEPRLMQQSPAYGYAPLDVYDYLEARVAACRAAGIAPERICVDPGIGFGKTLTHNLQILSRLALLHGLGCTLLLGVSRKSFIARIAGEGPAKGRLPGSLAAGLAGLDRGVQILRVHDVAETVQAIAVWRGIREA